MARTLILSSTSQIQVFGVKNALDEANIPYFEINKSDSSYPGIFGNYEIYVDEAHREEAVLCVKDLIATN
ncbi:putative signal transducing protein [Bizionia sp. KMM 8389]